MRSESVPGLPWPGRWGLPTLIAGDLEERLSRELDMKNLIWAAAASAFAAVALFAPAVGTLSAQSAGRAAIVTAASSPVEDRIWRLLDDPRPVYASLAEADFRSLGAGFDLPDGGRTVTDLAARAPGGAFDPRDLSGVPAARLGYKADWIVERYRRYNLEWDIPALRLTSLAPEARSYPWLVIVNGGAANFYEFFVDLKNRPGWAQYLAQKLNVMIVTIPGNFRYGGWETPIASPERQPAYLLDRELSMPEYELRNIVYTNSVIMQGLKALIMKHTSGPILIIGHSTSGELAMLANDDADLRARLEGRFLGWGSGGPARLARIQDAREDDGKGPLTATRETLPLHVLTRRDSASYSRGYSGRLNPMYEPGMSHYQIAEAWLATEARRRANFKQQIQDLEHAGGIDYKGRIELAVERALKASGNPWGVNAEDVSKDLFVTHYTRMEGYRDMVWMVAHYDRNHWVPEDPMRSPEVFFANEYRLRNPDARIRLIVWDLTMTHYGHLEMPRELASATYSVVRWLLRERTTQ
jgi:hypothetical protein